MNKAPLNLSVIRLLLVVAMLVSCLPDYVFAEEKDLKIYDSTVDFKHFAVELNPDNTLKSSDAHAIINTKFKTKVLESKYLKATLLPEYGGRMLSIIYKPTGRELLYQNPVGTPYGMGENNFYYNWLMVYGGIFPTFPEPEHGKTWCVPWDAKVVKQNDDQISVEMSFTDNIDPTQGVPRKFSKGRTDLTCIQTVTVYREKAYVDYNIKLINNKDAALEYEYWTCTTLAPGSEPGKTVSPPNSEIIVPISKVKLKDDWWPWMGKAEKALEPKDHVFEYKNLAFFKNWTDMGIAYANPSAEKGWWGVINHENKEGILRIADNKQYTPGLKLWTWGEEKGRKTNPESFGDAARPYIELWAGHSSEFFENAKMSPKEQKSWNEYYIPTVGLEKITYANQHAAVYLNYTVDEAKNEVVFDANIFTTHPDEPLKLNLSLKGDKKITLREKDFVGDPAKPDKTSIPISRALIDKGSKVFELALTTASGELLAQAELPLLEDSKSSMEAGLLAQKPTSAKWRNLMLIMISTGFVVLTATFLTIAIRKKKDKKFS
ncbi:MAG: DUF5107 domain-containing protein [Clostridia bacterium]|nr:DUF5107 domain-containing protein [Clostridia bacterium]